MPETPLPKLATILAADIAGYSALMGSDEERTVRDLKAHQATVLPMSVQVISALATPPGKISRTP
jgi:class 3 adenylate cyclase